ncbi:hypothetical protein EZS27_028440 [termite gut metagenome]|uniref:Uncharacterized protein n=1 Tax=termite gut metagenome TaxID=433724 RepID=A0A5J4QLW8_9ZZZZ
MENIKLFTDTQGYGSESLSFLRAIDCAKKVRDFLKESGITPTPEKITDFIMSDGKNMIDEIEEDLENELKTLKSELSKKNKEKEADDVIASIEGFISNLEKRGDFKKNVSLISIDPDTLDVKARSGYTDVLMERHTVYVENMDKYKDFEAVANQINRLADKYGLKVVLQYLFDVEDGRCVPNKRMVAY